MRSNKYWIWGNIRGQTHITHYLPPCLFLACVCTPVQISFVPMTKTREVHTKLPCDLFFGWVYISQEHEDKNQVGIVPTPPCHVLYINGYMWSYIPPYNNVFLLCACNIGATEISPYTCNITHGSTLGTPEEESKMTRRVAGYDGTSAMARGASTRGEQPDRRPTNR
jgi:hypothetical protein